MSYHSGVSCDSCMVSNFPGRRYKCLLCDNYDLCGKCFDEKAESRNHKNSHAMQCILTDTAAEVFYRGETIACRAVVSLTCPHCAQMGFIQRTLLAHCEEKHSSQGKNTPAVMCPICVASALHKGRSRFAALTEHIGTDHDDANVGTDDDLGALFLGHVRRTEAEEDSDEEADEEDEGPSWNDLEHSGFVEEERRRQQTARQRLANSSTLSAAIRNEYIAALSGNTMSSNGQRRSLSRQTAVRIPRGGYRGHFSSFPYGSTMRTNAGASSSVTGRNVPDTQTVSASQNTVYNDPYASLFSQDPLLEFISQIANGQCTSTGSTTNSSNTQLLVAPFVPVHMTSVTNTYSTDLARLQQQIENSETMTQMKTTLLNNKQKRSSQNQQQSSSQSATLNHLSAQEFQLWQQQLPGVQTNLSPSTILNNPHGNDLTFGNNSLSYSSLKLSHQDSDPRSLLGKIVRHETNVNTGEIDETRRVQLQDHVSFLHSLLLCSMTNSSDNDENQTKLTNKENHL